MEDSHALRLIALRLPGKLRPGTGVSAPATTRRWAPLGPDELARGERITEVARWIFLIFLLLNTHLGAPGSPSTLLPEDVVVAVWALGNLAITVLLLRGLKPNRYFAYGTTFFDLAVASSIYYLSGGFASSGLPLMFFMLIIAASVRFGLEASVVTALVVSLIYLLVGALTGPAGVPQAAVIVGRLFVFNFIALISGILVRDLRLQLEQAVVQAVQRTDELETARQREILERERAQRLQELDRMKSEFVAIVAHELQTPIAGIKAQADTLLSEEAHVDPESRGKMLRGIRDSSAELGQLVHDFSSVNRMDSQGFQYHLEPVDLKRLVEESARAIPIDAQRHRLRVWAEPGMRAMADPRRLQEALTNLVENAVKYSPRGGEVTVAAYVDPSGRARIAVRDDGIGIRPEDHDKLFQKFRRLWDARSAGVGGTGLGLYIARNIVEAHGGTIAVESEWGKGSTFAILLPLLGDRQGGSPDGH